MPSLPAFSQANVPGLGNVHQMAVARCGFAYLRAVSRTPDKGDYVSVRSYPFVLRLAAPGDLGEIRELVREAADWLRTSKDTDQWRTPWPDPAGQIERIRNDLLKGKVWLVWDGTVAAATITVDTEGPLALNEQPVWPADKIRESALYVRRVIVRRTYAGRGLGAALLDWAADVARRDYEAALIRIDVWTTNLDLHNYYIRQRFTPCEGREPRELANYPSQALFERKANRSGSAYRTIFVEEDGLGEPSLLTGRRTRRPLP
jgi:GNAT superfamily N-acetyltransferase